MKNTLHLITAGGLLAAGLPLTAMGQTISITATVNSQCNIGNATVALGAINLLGATITNTGTNIVLTCNQGATVSVALNNGSNNVAGTQKRLAVGGQFINYNLSQPTTPLTAGVNTCPALPGTEWTAAAPVAGTPMFAAAGGPRNIPLCVSVPTPQYPPNGAYTDTVTATLTVS
ncbi:MAG: spore coat protein U domain-containing protein [Burkholderiaceae bacterium]